MNAEGFETRIVGGAVRNALLSEPAADVDLATTALPQDTIRLVSRAGFKPVPTGVEHGTVTVVADGDVFEVTTLREDVETDGRRAVVQFGSSFEADAKRRDFTINALSVNEAGELFDYTDGLEDLRARRVRFIGDAATRIREDYLRILRFFRFHSQYATGAPDREALHAAVAERDGLKTLSRERVRAEFLKLLGSRRSEETVTAFADYGFIALLLGCALELGRFRRTASRSPVERLASLCVFIEEDADRLRTSLRLSNAEHRALVNYARVVAKLHTTTQVDTAILRRLVVERGLDAMTLAMTATQGEPRPDVTDEARAEIERFRSDAGSIPAFPLRGADFTALGVAKGPEVGALLAEARLRWLNDGCPMTDAYIRDLVQLVAVSCIKK
jgi:poly(A) polymerase